MRPLSKIIQRPMRIIALALVFVITFLLITIQIIDKHNAVHENSAKTLLRMEHMLYENQQDMTEIVHKYGYSCLNDADTIAYLIEKDPGIIKSFGELRRIAALLEVDEINLFNEEGIIFAGTNPEYFGYHLESGEQIRFFQAMKEDKSLRLVQAITPNTAKNKKMQYSAVWNRTGNIIVQVGMESSHIIKQTEKNDLNHIFSLFRVNPDANYYAINTESGNIVASTASEHVGKHAGEIGLSTKTILTHPDGFHANVGGINSFCVFSRIGTNYIGRVVASSTVYNGMFSTTAALFVCVVLIAALLISFSSRFMDRIVVGGMREVNQKLDLISKGNLEEKIDVHSSLEFSELSAYINEMVASLLNNSKKMQYVLSKTNLYIGVYEYRPHLKHVRFTEYIPHILGLSEAKAISLSSDYSSFRAFISDIQKNPVPGETNIFRLPGEGERYVRLEEMEEEDGIFGVCIDETEDIRKRLEIEAERDYDLLTGLLNRRGLDHQLHKLFRDPHDLGCGALIMLDADGLKIINDTYGHEKGDLYIKKISELIHPFGSAGSLTARQGGDEFVLLLYDYGSIEELMHTIRTLEHLQNTSTVQLSPSVTVPLRFSFGYSLLDGTSNYQKLFKDADIKMYENKRMRKSEQNT
ncbi:MAG: diguanylate cyclase [Bacillota bacterium]|nr:diguanylate cyclase [Bacillota bacterium]